MIFKIWPVAMGREFKSGERYTIFYREKIDIILRSLTLVFRVLNGLNNSTSPNLTIS